MNLRRPILPFLLAALAALPGAGRTAAQIRRDPVGVNVNSQGATSVLITFGGLARQQPVEALWCGALVPATPDRGLTCDPATIFGRLPLRVNQSALSADGTVFTDIMTIPATVSRRAYQAAARGENPSFFYVRRFSSLDGGPDEFVAVTCRLTGGGARSPLALLDVQLHYDSGETVAAVGRNGRPPHFAAQLRYNGTGTLRGRWEVLQPGDPPPASRDLLTEASLPPEERALQKRYTELGRFNLFLPPTGEAELPGPDPELLPRSTEGLYMILLRVEAGQDREAQSNLEAANAGEGVLSSAGVAGFPMPTLRYVVGSGLLPPSELAVLAPAEGAELATGAPLEVAWQLAPAALLYRVELANPDGTPLFAALLQQGIGQYRAPSWLAGMAPGGALTLRVVALGPAEAVIAATPWRSVHWRQGAPASPPPQP